MLNGVQGLMARLRAADGAWQREKALALAWRLVPLFLSLAALAVAADAFLQLGVGIRVACLGLGLAGLLAGAVAAAWVAWGCRNPAERVARHLEMRDPALGSRLINSLQLARQTEDRGVAELTRQLAAHAVEQNVATLDVAGLERLAVTGEARRRGRWAAWGVAAFAALLAAFFPVTRMVLPRFLDPTGDHPPYSFTRVELVDPGDAGVDVVYGGKFKVKAKWSGHEPRELFLTAHPPGRPQEGVTVPMVRDASSGFVQEIPDVRRDLVLVAHSKTRSYFSRQRVARVILTPRIERAFLRTAPPAYTGVTADERNFAFTTASAMTGSELRFRLQSNRPLKAGVIDVIHADERRESVPMSLAGTNEVSGSLVLKEATRVRFRVTDIDDLQSEPGPECLLSPTRDLPPTVRLVEPAQDGFVAEDYDLNLRIDADDDYGVRTLRVHRGVDGVFPEARTIAVEGIQRHAGLSEPVKFKELGVKPGQSVSFFAEVVDTAPEPQMARSQTVTLRVVSAEEYNDFLREERDVRDLAAKYEELLRQFNDLREEQNRITEAAKAQAAKAAAGDTNALRPDELDRLMARQNELNQRLEKQAKAMEQAVRENPLYDFEKDLQKQLAEEAAGIRASTATNSAAMNRIAADTSRPDGKRQVSPGDLARMEQEAREQAQRLGEQQKELAKSVEEPLEDLSKLHDLMNAFNAFQQLHEAQKQIAEQAAAYEKRGSNLSREDQLALKDLAAREDAVEELLKELPSMLRERAGAAEKKFPKAAESGRKLAESIEDARMGSLAGQAGERMLDGDGERGAQLAKRLEKEMESLFGQCEGQCPGQPGDELDQYLKLTLGGPQKQSLKQMQQCRKLGLAEGLIPKRGRGRGAGDGSGYSQQTGPQLSVLGNEKLVERGPKDASTRSASGNSSGPPGAGGETGTTTAKAEQLRGLNALDRQSGAVTAESQVEAYRPVVEEYFKAIMRRP